MNEPVSMQDSLCFTIWWVFLNLLGICKKVRAESSPQDPPPPLFVFLIFWLQSVKHIARPHFSHFLTEMEDFFPVICIFDKIVCILFTFNWYGNKVIKQIVIFLAKNCLAKYKILFIYISIFIFSFILYYLTKTSLVLFCSFKYQLN